MQPARLQCSRWKARGGPSIHLLKVRNDGAFGASNTRADNVPLKLAAEDSFYLQGRNRRQAERFTDHLPLHVEDGDARASDDQYSPAGSRQHE